MSLRLATFIFFSLLACHGFAQTENEKFDRQLEERIKTLEAQLSKTFNPAKKEALEGLIKKMKRGELFLTRPVNKDDRWNLVDIQFSPETTQKTTKKLDRFRTGIGGTVTTEKLASENGFQSKSLIKSDRANEPDRESFYRLTVSKPPPTSLKPDDVFEFAAKTNGTLIPRLQFYQTNGKEIFEDRQLKALKHIDGKRPGAKLLSENKGIKTAEIKYRVRFPKENMPLFFRYGIASSDSKMRVVFVYRLNARPLPQTQITVLDANPKFNFETFPKKLRPSQLIRANKIRAGTISDGVSQLILRAELSQKTDVKFQLKESEDGNIEPLLGGRTITFEDRHFSFALYTPPKVFSQQIKERPKSLFHPKLQPKKRLEDVLEFRDVSVSVAATNKSFTKKVDFELARPPIVLVHGFTSDPYKCWVETTSSGTSMTVLLERAGLMPFLVSYAKTNGIPGISSENSSFRDNAMAVWDRADEFEYERYDNYFRNKEQPIVSEFQRLDPKRIGGIKQALEYYREEFGLAATQADVIGHSMGGLLARIYASENYNKTYKRPENFSKGDINRLITLNTPHHGSELAHLHRALLEVKVDDEAFSKWAVRKLVRELELFFLGDKPSPAAVDLAAPITPDQQRSSALFNIGETEIPAHAIATHSDGLRGGLDESNMYYLAYGTVGMVFFYNRPLLNNFIRRRADEWSSGDEGVRVETNSDDKLESVSMDDEEAIREFTRIVSSNIDTNARYWESRREKKYRDERRDQVDSTQIVPFGALDNDQSEDPPGWKEWALGKVSQMLLGGNLLKLRNPDEEQEVPSSTIRQVRDLIFHNDHLNDGAVRVESQYGDLSAPHTTTLPKVLHSFSPWSYAVQRKVIHLLKWENDGFDPSGFPPAGRLLPRYLPNRSLTVDRVYGKTAIDWSGLVYEHAKAYAEVADREETIILVRPVNQDSTKLIGEEGAATKAMAVKGKSSNWGPQTGYIPVQQRFSKLWQVHKDNPVVRDLKIEEYDTITQEMLLEKHPINTDKFYAKERELEKKINGTLYKVLTDPKEPDAEKAVYLFNNGTFLDINLKEIKLEAKVAKRVRDNPMMVLADGLQDKDPRLYLTADYDLLAIGRYVETIKKPGQPADEVATSPLDKLQGYVSPIQKKVIFRLNQAVRRTGYDGGDVTHHGPENQYPKSPYIDYPILVCDPGDPEERNDQEIFIIRQGPPGFRDIHLKRYFSSKIREGFQLWANPKGNGWLWQSFGKKQDTFGYDPRDSPDLAPYVLEQLPPDIEKQDVQKLLPEQSFKHFSLLAMHRNEKALAELALHYRDGIGTSPDIDQYRRILAQLENSKTSYAKTVYANALLEGSIGKPDVERAIELLNEVVAADNHLEAHYILGELYYFGEGVQADLAKAHHHFQQAHEQGDSTATFMLAEMNFYGDHVPKNIDASMKLYEKASKDGVPEASAALGFIHADDQLGKTDFPKAVQYLQKASEKGKDPEVIATLAAIYAAGEKGVPKDDGKATELYLEAAKAGHKESQVTVGDAYLNGSGVEKDAIEAFVWYKRAVLSGNFMAVEKFNALLKSFGKEQKQEAEDAFRKRFGGS